MAYQLSKADETGRELQLKVEPTPTLITLRFPNWSPKQINQFRRIILDEVESVAVDQVTIYDNTSRLSDDQLANRISLFPVEEGIYNIRQYNTGPDRIDVEFPPGSGYRLITLLPGEQITIEITTRKGKGREHAKFRPATIEKYLLTGDGGQIDLRLTGTIPESELIQQAFDLMPIT